MLQELRAPCMISLGSATRSAGLCKTSIADERHCWQNVLCMQCGISEGPLHLQASMDRIKADSQ